MRRAARWLAARACGAALGAGLIAGGAGLAPAQEPGLAALGRVEQLHLDDVFPLASGEPGLELRFRALTRSGASVVGLGPPDVELWENGERVPAQRLSLLALQDSGEGLAVALLLDASATMRGSFARVVQEAQLALAQLRPQDRVAVFSFARDVRAHAGFGLARAQTRAALAALAVERQRSQGTLLYDAVYEVSERLRAQPGLPRRALIALFADGEDDGSRRSLAQAVARARGSADEVPIAIHALGFAGSAGGRELGALRELAVGTGGELLEERAGVRSSDFFERAFASLRASYVLRLRTELDGAPHQLRLLVQERSAQRAVLYPARGLRLWPWLAAGAALVASGALGLAALWWWRGGAAGRLAVVSGPAQGTVYELRPGRNRIGALEDNDIVLISSRVSRYHAEIVARGRRARIADLRSTNGTRVNGQAVAASPLRAGDRIAIADVEVIYQA